MEDLPTYMDQIPDYLDGLLTATEREAFEARLQQDEALAKEVALYRQVIATLGNTSQRSFRDRLEVINRETPVPDRSGNKGRKIFSLRFLMSIAAAVLALVAAGIWFLNPNPSAQELLASHIAQFDPADILPPPYISPDRRGDDTVKVIIPATPSDTILHRARELFTQKAYTRALATMEQIDPATLQNNAVYYYEKGVLYLLTDQPVQAINALEQIQGPARQNARHWYLALCYLQLERIDDCRAQLGYLVEEVNPWQGKAKELLGSL